MPTQVGFARLAPGFQPVRLGALGAGRYVQPHIELVLQCKDVPPERLYDGYDVFITVN